MKYLQFMLMEIDPNDPPDEGPFYVIEKFHEPVFVVNENGDPKCFVTYLEAAAEAADCQNGFVLSF